MKIRNHRLTIIIAVLLVFALVLPACSGAASTTTPSQEPVTLKMVLLPVLDTLPIYVAQQEGLFEANGIKVEIIPVAAPGERDQVVVSGQADGMINELLSTAVSNQNELTLKVVRYARIATPEFALFRLIASGKSDINTVDDLKGVEIGISQGTIIEYWIYRLLQAEGFGPDEIKTIAVPKIPDRMSLLGSGELKAAVLPDPTSSLAIQQGGRLILDDTRHPEYSFSTIAFRQAVIDAHPEAIRAFLKAIEEATQKINTNPSQYTSLLKDQNIVPAPLLETFVIPKFVTAGVPDQKQWDDMLAWATEKGLITKDVAYSDTVTAEFLP